MSIIKKLLIFLIVIIYTTAATTRDPDSDYQSYITFFQSEEILNACYFEIGFCYLVWASKKIGFSSAITYGLLYGTLLFTVLILYMKNLKTSVNLFLSLIIVIIFLLVINDFYMAFHLYRQNFAVLLYAGLIFFNPILALIAGGLFHSSLLLSLPAYLLIKNFKFNNFKAGLLFMLILIILYLIGTSLNKVLIVLSWIDLNFIKVRAEIYEDYPLPGSINAAPLFVYIFMVFSLVYNLNGRGLKVFDALFYLFLSSTLMACITSFNEMVSYRFLVIAKILSLPILLMAVPTMIRTLNNTLKSKGRHN